MAIFVCLDLDARQSERLRGLAGEAELHLRPCLPADAPLDPDFASGEIVFGNPPPGWLPANQALRWLQLESVGFGEYAALDWAVLGRRATVTNLAGFFAEPVAETALAGILALHRGIDRLVRLQAAHEWQGDALRPSLRRLAGARVVLFGQGAINRQLAALLAPFGCTIRSFGRDWQAAELDGELAAADIVASAVPDRPETRNVFDRRRLAGLPPDAVFVNSGRGSVVDETALIEALRAGRLGGAVIDVTQAEPLPADHPFWTCPNLILTQHTGGGTADEIDRKIDLFAANLARYQLGLPLTSVVDFARGY